MNIRKCDLVSLPSKLVLASLLLSTSSYAVTINFEDVAPLGDAAVPIAPYQEGGYLFTSNNDDNGIFSSGFLGNPAGFLTDYLTFNAPTTTVILAENTGAIFNLISLDFGVGAAAEAFPVDFTITGNLSDGSNLVATFSDVERVQSEILNWSDLVSVEFSASDDIGLDNIVVVPEPSVLFVVLSGMVVCLLRRTR